MVGRPTVTTQYLANVITGKAYLLLGKRAKTIQHQEQLAWKVKHFLCYK